MSVWAAVAVLAAISLAGVWAAAKQGPGCPLIMRLASVAVIVASGLQAASLAQTQVPVVQRVSVDILARGPQQVTLTMWGDKVRACRFASAKAYVIGARGALFEARLTWPDDPSPGDSRPLGWQGFGLAHVTWPAMSEPVKALRLDAWHDCGRALMPVHTVVGPVSVPPESWASDPMTQPSY